MHLPHSTVKRHHSGVRLTHHERHQLHNLQHRQFWTVTEHEPGLSSKYGNVPLALQGWQMPSNTVIIIAKWHLWTSHYTPSGMELLHNLQPSHALMYTHNTHTHYTPADFCWRKTSSCWRFSASLRHGAVGEGEEWVRGGRIKHFSFVQAKESCNYAEAMKQQIICAKC